MADEARIARARAAFADYRYFNDDDGHDRDRIAAEFAEQEITAAMTSHLPALVPDTLSMPQALARAIEDSDVERATHLRASAIGVGGDKCPPRLARAYDELVKQHDGGA